MKLRRSHLEQLDTYLNHVKQEGWYYGKKEQFVKRHEELQKWVDRLMLENKDTQCK